MNVNVDEVGLCGLALTNNDRICNSCCAREMILRCIVLDEGYFDPNLCIFGWYDLALRRRRWYFQFAALQTRLSSLCVCFWPSSKSRDCLLLQVATRGLFCFVDARWE